MAVLEAVDVRFHALEAGVGVAARAALGTRLAPVGLEAAARGSAESLLGGRPVKTIFRDLVSARVAIVKSLESLEVLRPNVTGGQVVKVNRVRSGVGVSESVSLQSVQPVVVVGGVERPATLVVGGARLGSEADVALVVEVPVVEQVLLGAGSEGRVQGDVVALSFSGSFQGVGRSGLKLVDAGRGALDSRGVKSGEGMAHGFELSDDLVGHAIHDGGAAASGGSESAGVLVALVIVLASRALVALVLHGFRSSQGRHSEESVGLLKEPGKHDVL